MRTIVVVEHGGFRFWWLVKSGVTVKIEHLVDQRTEWPSWQWQMDPVPGDVGFEQTIAALEEQCRQWVLDWQEAEADER